MWRARIQKNSIEHPIHVIVISNGVFEIELSQPPLRCNIFGKGGKFFDWVLIDGIVIVVVLSKRVSEMEMLKGNGSQKSLLPILRIETAKIENKNKYKQTSWIN